MVAATWQFAKTGAQSATILFTPTELDPDQYGIKLGGDVWEQLPNGSLKDLLNRKYDVGSVPVILASFFTAQAKKGFNFFANGTPSAPYSFSVGIELEVDHPYRYYPFVVVYRDTGTDLGYVKLAVNYSASE